MHLSRWGASLRARRISEQPALKRREYFQRFLQKQLTVSVAISRFPVHSVAVPYRPKKSKKPQTKPGDPKSGQSSDYQFLDQRRRDFTTRNILSRLRNRKSDIK
ncbi:MAG TPA: hypothetical protein VG938_08855 [Verrucomicrobiae bacterium]|jgi:hypothetical protein|nr:hypothetical protein [Verrucomicrobiae bacterium]